MKRYREGDVVWMNPKVALRVERVDPDGVVMCVKVDARGDEGVLCQWEDEVGTTLRCAFTPDELSPVAKN